MMKQQLGIFLLATCLMILLLSSQVFSLSEKVNRQQLEKEFAAAFEKNERHMRENKIHKMEKSERFISTPTNHFVIKTKTDSTEADDLIKRIAEEFSLVQVRKIPGPNFTAHILRKTLQSSDNERSVRAALDTQAMSNIVKKYSTQILDFYNEKKNNYSKR
ncbi:predicted protein [Naegleria gruberi]|uniref:Predicted protein n=1 Tax=Naegleria gruberi TaxID=5762 RepID=D2VLG2_NAEGR|nr:uncharacterized protein NAEGRDRAFT_69768 [Naegleria gruberi]EFC42306.1 predicted protein [Naegleria gruberi]|eukprot:XP_002675050.1 predicted protein [Naegleria gruberi strain NEG-M]